MAVHLGEAGFSQPTHLLGELRKPVGRIVLDPTDLAAEALMEALRRRTDEIEIRKDPARSEHTVYFREQLLLAIVLEVVDYQSRDDDIERSGRREGVSKVVLTQLDPGIALISSAISRWGTSRPRYSATRP